MTKGKKIIGIFFSIVEVIEKASGYLLIAGLAAIVFLMMMQIFNRYALKNPFVWTEELCRFIFILITFIGAGLALRRFEIIAVTFILERAPFKVQNLIWAVGLLGVTFFTYILIKYGTNLLFMSRETKVISAALRVPIYVVYIIFPLGGMIMFIMSIACVIEVIMGKKRLNQVSKG